MPQRECSCGKPAVREGRCVVCLAIRLARLGPCTDCLKHGIVRVTHAKGLCSSCHRRSLRYGITERAGYNGVDELRGNFHTLVEAITETLLVYLPSYLAYINNTGDYDECHIVLVDELLLMAQRGLSIDQFNSLIGRLNRYCPPRKGIRSLWRLDPHGTSTSQASDPSSTGHDINGVHRTEHDAQYASRSNGGV